MSINKPYVSDKKWFAARPERTHRIRRPNSNEGYTWVKGSTHVLVQRMLISGSLAKVPVNLSATCKHCLKELDAIADREEESMLDCNIHNFMRWAIATQYPHGSQNHRALTIENDFWVGLRHHSSHPPQPVKRPPTSTKPYR
jgi:hypothetical protein